MKSKQDLRKQNIKENSLQIFPYSQTWAIKTGNDRDYGNIGPNTPVNERELIELGENSTSPSVNVNENLGGDSYREIMYCTEMRQNIDLKSGLVL